MSFYQNEILFLKKETEVVIMKIKMQENYMNYKEANATLSPQDVDDIIQLILKYFRILALIGAYSFFEIRNEPLTDENTSSFVNIVNNYYFKRLTKFIEKLSLYVIQSP